MILVSVFHSSLTSIQLADSARYLFVLQVPFGILIYCIVLLLLDTVFLGNFTISLMELVSICAESTKLTILPMIPVVAILRDLSSMLPPENVKFLFVSMVRSGAPPFSDVCVTQDMHSVQQEKYVGPYVLQVQC